MSAPLQIRAVVIDGRPTVVELSALLHALKPWGVGVSAIVDHGNALPEEVEPDVLDAVIDLVASELSVGRTIIVGKSASPALTPARAAICWLGRYVLGWSTTPIGKRMGRHHSVVIYQSRRAFELRESDPAFKELTDRLAGTVRELVR